MTNNADRSSQSRFVVWVGLAAAIIVAIGLIIFKRHSIQSKLQNGTTTTSPDTSVGETQNTFVSRGRSTASSQSPKTEVSDRLKRYTSKRRDLIERYAAKLGVALPKEMDDFFAAVEKGDLKEMNRQRDLLRSRAIGGSKEDQDKLAALTPILTEIIGVTQQTQQWPADALLDYGNSILASLRPGMVYFGGTDAGRFIPTLMSETGPGQPNIVLTQNALADSSYLDYLRFAYGDQLACLTPEDSQKSFQDYLQDAQRRAEHDRNLPDEPKQLRANESVLAEKGRVQVSGSAAVMAINERLVQELLNKNPNLSFALEESIPLASTYNNAVPLGPVMELNTKRQDFNADAATSALNYWQQAAGRLQDGSSPSPQADAYSRMIAAQANLFANHNLLPQAEEAYRLAYRLGPENPQTVDQLTSFLARNGKQAEADQLRQEFQTKHPSVKLP